MRNDYDTIILLLRASLIIILAEQHIVIEYYLPSDRCACGGRVAFSTREFRKCIYRRKCISVPVFVMSVETSTKPVNIIITIK